METRGRKQNADIILKVREMKEQGISTNIIADRLGISAAMARYYMRCNIKEDIKRESLTACFFRQPIEVQKRIAEEIGYLLPTEKATNNVQETYQKIEKAVSENKEREEESDLLFRCMKFLLGKVPPNAIDDVFNQDEIDKLSKIKMFVSKSKEIFGGEKSPYSTDEVIEELKKNKIK